jgi:MFS family permease
MRSPTDRVTERRGRRGARAAAFLAFGAALAFTALTGASFVVSSAVSPDLGLIVLATVTMATVGVVLAIRVPANLVGWLLLVSAVVLSGGFLGLVYAEWSRISFDGSLPGTAVAAWIYSNLFVVPVLIMVVGIPLIYPDGRLLSPRWRWLVAVLIWSLVTFTVREGLRPGLISGTTFENPFGVAGIEPLLDVLQLPDVFGVALFVGATASVAIRYRRAGRVERQQLKWLIGATALSVVAWSVVTIGQVVGASTVVTIGWIFALLCFSALPIAIGIAVLRYRLYEIDRIISRTIAWALVTGVLVAVFASVVVMLQTALIGITQGQTLAVAASTLVALALFQPLRRRVQHAVDRRFDRARYDGERTVASFTGRLRGEVDLDALEVAVADTVRDALHPSSAVLWVRSGPDRT